MSYRSIMLYNAIIPSSSVNSKKDEKQINASDPKNRQEVHKIMFG